MSDFTQVGLAQLALTYTESTVTLTSAQAAGNEPIVSANPDRQGIKILAASNFQVAIASGSTVGLNAFGGLGYESAGPETPANDLYVLGLTTGTKVTVWEA